MRHVGISEADEREARHKLSDVLWRPAIPAPCSGPPYGRSAPNEPIIFLGNPLFVDVHRPITASGPSVD